MTIQKCYKLLKGDYEAVYEHIPDDKIIEQFIIKFLEDDTFDHLREAVRRKDDDGAFIAVHTLKGLSLNLGFTRLGHLCAQLTEQLRSRKGFIDMRLYKKVSRTYKNNIKIIRKYKNKMA